MEREELLKPKQAIAKTLLIQIRHKFPQLLSRNEVKGFQQRLNIIYRK